MYLDPVATTTSATSYLNGLSLPLSVKAFLWWEMILTCETASQEYLTISNRTSSSENRFTSSLTKPVYRTLVWSDCVPQLFDLCRFIHSLICSCMQ